MSFFSDLFGGSKTTVVTQQHSTTQVSVNPTVGVANIIDTQPLADANAQLSDAVAQGNTQLAQAITAQGQSFSDAAAKVSAAVQGVGKELVIAVVSGLIVSSLVRAK